MPVKDSAQLDILIKANSAEAASANRELDKMKLNASETSGRLKQFADSENVASRASKTMGDDLGKSGRAFDGLGKAATIAFTAIVAGVGLAAAALISFFKSGLTELAQYEDALGRMSISAENAGLSIDRLSRAADDLTADKLIDTTDALKTFADLADKGFGEDQIIQLGTALKDIAASVGGNVLDNFNKLSDALVTGRARSAEMQRMLPGLTSEIERVGLSAEDMADESKQAQIQQALFNAVMERGQEVAGAAADKLQTLAGQTQAVQGAISDLKEEFAEAILKGFSDGTTKVHDFAGEIAALEPAVRSLGGAIGDLSKSLVVGLAQAFNSVQGFVSVARRQWLELANVSNILAQAVVKFAIQSVSAMAQIPGAGKLLQGTLDSLSDSYSALRVDGVRLNIEIAEEHERFKALAIQSGILGGEIIDVTKLFSGMGKETDKTTGGFNRLTGAYDKNGAAAKKTAAEAKKLAEANAKYLQTLRDLENDTDLALSSFISLTSSVEKLNPSINFLGASLDTSGTSLNNITNTIRTSALKGIADLDLGIKNVTASGDKFTVTIDFATVQTDAFAETIDDLLPLLDKQEVALLKVAAAEAVAATKLEDLISFANQAANTLGMLGQQTGGTLGALLNAGGSGFAAFESILESGGGKARAIAGGIGAAMGAMAAATEGAVSKMLNAGSMLLMGFATGGVWGLALAAVVIGISALIDSMETGADKAQDAAGFLGFAISDQLSKQIHEFGKNLTSTANEILVSLDLIAAEVGISSVNVVSFITGFTRAFQEFHAESAAMIEVVKDLNQLLPQMLDASTDAFGVLSDEMLAFIEVVQATGVEVKALTDFMTSQFSNAAGALTALIDQWAAGLPEDLDLLGLKALINTRQEATDFMSLIMAQMNEMVAQGMSLHDIFTQLGPAINTLRDAAIDLGLRSDPAFRSFFALFRVMRSEAAGTLANINTLMTSFANLGILNQQTFGSLQRILDDVFAKFNADGKISRAEMIALLPTLAQMRAMAEKYGLTLDDATQAMIDLAIERGLLPEEMPVDPMIDFANVIRDELIPAITLMTEGIFTFIEGVLGIPSQIGTTVTTTYTTAGIPPGAPSNTFPKRPRFDTLQQPIVFNRTSDITVDRGEMLLDRNTTRRMQSSEPTFRQRPPAVHVHHHFNRREIAETIIELGEDGTLNSLRTV